MTAERSISHPIEPDRPTLLGAVSAPSIRGHLERLLSCTEWRVTVAFGLDCDGHSPPCVLILRGPGAAVERYVRAAYPGATLVMEPDVRIN